MTEPIRAQSRAAIERALDRLLAGLGEAFRVRLWDDSEIHVGEGEAMFTLVVRDRSTFRQVFRTGQTRAFAEAFVADRLDIEGDLFAALRVAAELESRRLTTRDRFMLWQACRYA